jgi:O-antigen ligase
MEATIPSRVAQRQPLAGERIQPMGWDLRMAILFLFFYYIRPQDWVAGMGGLNVVQPLILCWVFAIYNERALAKQKFIETPLDWLMVIYLAYAALTSDAAFDTFKSFVPNTAFFFLTLFSLNTIEKLKTYLKWWLLMIAAVALIAVLSLYGIDITGARDVTARQNGRLAIGTWMHGNPNALGHSVTVLFAAAYFFHFWRGTATGRTVIYPAICVIAGYCVIATESKGAFIVGAGLLVMIFVIGRPWKMKLVALGAALSLGISAISFLPRMNQLNTENLASVPGVAGRLMTWDVARAVYRSEPTGAGYRKFVAYITWEKETQMKATHSSYVQIGADLGRYGLFIFVAILWASAFTLMRMAKIGERLPEDFERCRRVVFILLLGYVFTSWMVNKEYHPEYFLVAACAAALQRLVMRRAGDTEDLAITEPKIAPIPRPSRKSREIIRSTSQLQSKRLKTDLEYEEEELNPVKVGNWKFNLIHILISITLTYAVFWYWSDQIDKNL